MSRLSRYRVIRYTPGSTGEFVNIAVVAYDDNYVLARVRKDVTFSVPFEGLDRANIVDYVSQFEGMTPEEIHGYVSHGMSCYQMDKPCSSILTAEALIDDIAPYMFGEEDEDGR